MKILNDYELKIFRNKYFKVYGDDIITVSYVVHNNIIEYLINEHYIFKKYKRAK